MSFRFFILFLIVFWFLSCGDTGQYRGSGPGNSPNPSDQQPPSSCKEWGGVTCTSGGNRDPQFLNFLSSGSLTTPKSIGDISCSPSDSGGIIFKLRVALNSPLQTKSDHPHQMQPASSSFEIQIMDSHVETQINGPELKPISVTFQGTGGTINNNKADLQFRYNSNNGWKEIRMEGTVEGNLFKGKILFENEKFCSSQHSSGQCVHTTPGRSGVLGNFTSPICPGTFTSN
ncbi:MAG: hypothetical protein OXM55_04095 [Bdellovibrionales bacterium]|nr:hypothetical protein [Bdellovibrionales bacterium]